MKKILVLCLISQMTFANVYQGDVTQEELHEFLLNVEGAEEVSGNNKVTSRPFCIRARRLMSEGKKPPYRIGPSIKGRPNSNLWKPCDASYVSRLFAQLKHLKKCHDKFRKLGKDKLAKAFINSALNQNVGAFDSLSNFKSYKLRSKSSLKKGVRGRSVRKVNSLYSNPTQSAIQTVPGAPHLVPYLRLGFKHSTGVNHIYTFKGRLQAASVPKGFKGKPPRVVKNMVAVAGMWSGSSQQQANNFPFLCTDRGTSSSAKGASRSSLISDDRMIICPFGKTPSRISDIELAVAPQGIPATLPDKLHFDSGETKVKGATLYTLAPGGGTVSKAPGSSHLFDDWIEQLITTKVYQNICGSKNSVDVYIMTSASGAPTASNKAIVDNRWRETDLAVRAAVAKVKSLPLFKWINDPKFGGHTSFKINVLTKAQVNKAAASMTSIPGSASGVKSGPHLISNATQIGGANGNASYQYVDVEVF